MAYQRWPGSVPTGRPTICVHGLTRNSHDFDRVAAHLSARGGPVLAADMPGRGASPWLEHKADYGYPTYVADVACLIASLGVGSVDYIGTSMGGIIGMMVAAQKNSPIRRLILNDVGPFIPVASLQRIAAYVGRDPVFADVAELEAYFRGVHAPFGALTDADWQHMARYGGRILPDGKVGLGYDPAIGDAFSGKELSDVDLWSFWDRITCPVLVIRGAHSDLLLAETAQEMTRRGPKATLFTVPDAGHAPALMADDQIAAIADFLAAS